MRRRDFLTRSLSVCAAAPLLTPVLGATPTTRKYSARAADLVQNSNVIDMLSLPTLNWQLLERWHESPDAFTSADFEKLRSSGINVFHPAVAFEKEDTHDITKSWFSKWNRFIDNHPDYFLRIDESGDLAKAQQQNKIGIILGMQDANHVRCINDVNDFYMLGQRLLQLTYNSINRLGSGCKIAMDKGLTDYGAGVVERANSIGMALDVSHTGERTSLDAISASKKPVLITHSNCKAIAPGVARCKSDEVIRSAARKGGVIGITSVRQFVQGKNPVTVENVLNHFDHAVKLVGVEHAGLGSDFDLDPHPAYDVSGLNSPNRVYELTEGLIRRGYTDDHIRGMLGGNFERVLKEIWTVPVTAPQS